MRRTLPAIAATLVWACGLTPPPSGSGSQQPQAPNAPQTPPTSPGTPSTPAAPPFPGYALVWQDDFDGTSLGTSWNVFSGMRLGSVATRDAVSVRDGVLTLTTYTDPSGVHHTGFLDTRGTVENTYGYYEARIRFDDAPGEWCAFWLDSPTNGRPPNDPAQAGVEIDVVEHRVTDQGGWTGLRDMVGMALNWDVAVSSPRHNVAYVAPAPGAAPVQGTWHVFAVNWTESGYTFYVDGDPLWTTTTAISNRSEYLQLTCEVLDQSWAGNVPPAGYGAFGASTTGMQVDWVRIWQKR
jgi:beta-glucanase (GH16 family)